MKIYVMAFQRVHLSMYIIIDTHSSPYVRESSTVLDSGFHAVNSGFQYFSLELEFWIPIVSGIPKFLSCIPDSKTQDSEFHKQNFLGFWIPQQGLKFKFEFGSTCAILDVNFWAHG